MGDLSLHPPVHAVREAVARALAEDLTPLGDLSAALLPSDIAARATFVSRQHGVVAGTRCAGEAFAQIDPSLVVVWQLDDGAGVEPGSVIGTVEGAIAPILSAERTALNFLGHLSGVATRVRQFVDRAGDGIRVWDTRKTTPGLRALEKAAVRAGGGRNHRGNLSDWVMLKDNHLMGIGITAGVALAKDRWPGRTIHVEADRLAQVTAAYGARRPLLEVSGGITLETIQSYADTGADLVSSGSLTNSAPVLDIGLDILRADDVRAR